VAVTRIIPTQVASKTADLLTFMEKSPFLFVDVETIIVLLQQ
jgi:hypothetical protein